MDCRETQTLLTAFHDGELPAADRTRVEEHLRGCPECGALLAGLERVDRAAGVPDPGPAYWDRFNARVMDRVEREADGTEVRVLRPKGGWFREQLRYLVPAAAAAALVIVIAHYGGLRPGVPAPTAPPAVTTPAAPVLTEERSAVTREMQDRMADGRGRPGAEAGRGAAGSRVTADRSPATGSEVSSRERATPPAPVAASSPPPVMAYKSAPGGQELPSAGTGRGAAGSGVPAGGQDGTGAGTDRNVAGSVAPSAASPPATAADGMRREMQAERKKMEAAAVPQGGQQTVGASKPVSGMKSARETPAGSPCDLARDLAGRGRIRDAETAQRACLAGDLDAPSREKGLVFLAELLDRQARFSEADAVISEVEKQYPQSRPLDLYRRQRPMVQKEPAAVPVTR
jgi:hypothetical protein